MQPQCIWANLMCVHPCGAPLTSPQAVQPSGQFSPSQREVRVSWR